MMNIYQTARKQVHNTYLMSFITIYYAQNFWQHKKRVWNKILFVAQSKHTITNYVGQKNDDLEYL